MPVLKPLKWGLCLDIRRKDKIPIWHLGVLLLKISLGAILGLMILTSLFALDHYFPLDLSRFHSASTVVLDKDDKLVHVFLSKDEKWRMPISLREVDPKFIEMLVAFEDKRFFDHHGVDFLALLRASYQCLKAGRIVSGGSTITLQTVRLLSPKPRNLVNKLIEMARAFQLEYHYSKSDILKMYLKLAPYGGNLEGLKAASYSYFGKSPRRLRLSEAALLVALPQSPLRLHPIRHPNQARKARDKVLERLRQQNILKANVAKEAMEDPIPFSQHPFPRFAPHLAYQLQKTSHKDLYLTTLDLELQKRMEDIVKQKLSSLGLQQTIAVMIVDNKTRHVLAHVGSGDFFDALRAGQVNMVEAIRSPGSLLKPFIYGLGFDAGFIHPDTSILDSLRSFSGYAPRNFRDHFHGDVTIKEALQQSLNVPAVSVLEKLGPVVFAEHLRTLGINLRFQDIDTKSTLAIALGGLGLHLRDLVSLYTALANEGKFKKLCFEREDKQTLQAEPLTMISPTSAAYISDILANVPAPQGFVDRSTTLQAPLAYKTGTSYGYRDAWAIGYTPDFNIGVWVGRADGTPCVDQTGRMNAAPILFKVASFLPYSGKRFPSVQLDKPKQALFQTTSPIQKKTPKLDISFPKMGSVISVERLPDIAGKMYGPIELTLLRGDPPFYLMVNDEPLPTPFDTHRIRWIPNTLGFTEFTVVDAKGESASVLVELR